jgi:hypothetical protein
VHGKEEQSDRIREEDYDGDMDDDDDDDGVEGEYDNHM